MCGFAGVLDQSGVQNYDIDQMIRVILHRGPDQQRSKTIDNLVKIGFARLAIIDLAGGSQPMSNDDESITVMLNGEIYNYVELAEELKRDGVVFHTSSDTEVMLHMYEKYGMEMLPRLQGMYGITIIDRNTHEVFLIRDRVGIKPLYYTNTKAGQIGFASEIKPLLQLPYVSKKIRKESIAEFLEFEYVQAPYTVFEDIKKVMPGHYIRLTDNQMEEICYWDCNEVPEKSDMTLEEAKKGVLDELRQSLKLHLRSDVQLGCFLSGGIDSGLLVALASEQVNNLDTYTLKFDNGDFDETGLAELVAKRYRTNHHCYTVKADDFKQLLPEMLWFFDEPIGDSGILPNYIINELVAKDGTKVILSGAGGDELFGGYNYYFPNKKEEVFRKHPVMAKAAIQLVKNAKPELAAKIQRALDFDANPLEHMIIHERTFGQEEVESLLGVASAGTDVKRVYGTRMKQSGLNQKLYMDMKTYLVDDLLLLSDRSCMAYSVEGRVPFVHHPLIEFALQIPEKIKAPNNQRKWLLKEVAKDFLPEELFNAPKMGFCSPIQRWADQGLSEWAYELLNSKRAMQREVWNGGSYRAFVSDRKNYENHFDKVYLLLVLELFFRVHVDNVFYSKDEIDMEQIYG